MFNHQDYLFVPSQDSYELIGTGALTPPGSSEFGSILRSAGACLQDSGVSRVILVHGTMVGTDALGWYSHWQRATPRFATKLKSTYQSIAERLSGDQGNFTAQYESLLFDSINLFEKDANEQRIKKTEVERFSWTSENHHLGRANAAVALAYRLINLAENGDGRILLIGHSHAGNVFALVTQLLGLAGGSSSSSRSALKQFFDAGRCFKTSSGRIDVDAWRALETRLCSASVFAKPILDIVTMGTPVRYGWNLSGCENLLHFVNHSPEGNEPFRGIVPANPQEFLKAIAGLYGDFVQQTFIAQTDLPPAIWSWNAWSANRKLHRILESKERNATRTVGISQGVRVAQSGKTLLVDYAQADPTATNLAGHSVYTKADWMAFQLQEIVSRFYSP